MPVQISTYCKMVRYPSPAVAWQVGIGGIGSETEGCVQLRSEVGLLLLLRQEESAERSILLQCKA